MREESRSAKFVARFGIEEPRKHFPWIDVKSSKSCGEGWNGYRSIAGGNWKHVSVQKWRKISRKSQNFFQIQFSFYFKQNRQQDQIIMGLVFDAVPQKSSLKLNLSSSLLQSTSIDWLQVPLSIQFRNVPIADDVAQDKFHNDISFTC